MATEFKLPKLAESVVEGEIVQWLVQEGEPIAVDQAIVEVMSDKATVELTSTVAGVVSKHLAGEGDVVDVGATIALIDESGGSDKAAPTREEEPDSPAEAVAEEIEGGPDLFKPTEDRSTGAAVQVSRPAAATKSAPKRQAATGPYGRVLAVPAARRLARELGIDIEELHGSGPNGRIRVSDVEQGATPAPAAGSGLPAPVQYHTPAGFEERETREKLRGIRRLTSQQMVASHLHTVRALHVDEADVSELVKLRAKLKPFVAERGGKLSYLPFIMKAVVAGLKRFPMLNTSLDEAAGEIVHKDYWNMTMAVSTERGLMVPVIRNVDQLDLFELAESIQDVAERARSGNLQPDELQGGTFSITNIGSVGGLFSFPIINVPEAAILGVHSIRRRPKVMPDDSIAPADMLYLSLSFDHRLVDGAEAAAFTNFVIGLLEEPERLLLEMR